MWDLIFNILISGLMMGALYMGVRLDKRLRLFQKHRDTLDGLSQTLQATLLRAEEGLKNLQEISHTQGNFLQEKISQARRLQDELSFVVDHGEKLSARLEEEITETRKYLRPLPASPEYGAPFPSSLYPDSPGFAKPSSPPLPPSEGILEAKGPLEYLKTLENLR
jgi:hypothetical protein